MARALGLQQAQHGSEAIYRQETIIGRGMRSRTLAGQLAEVQLACGVLNTMTCLVMPDGYGAG